MTLSRKNVEDVVLSNPEVWRRQVSVPPVCEKLAGDTNLGFKTNGRSLMILPVMKEKTGV